MTLITLRTDAPSAHRRRRSVRIWIYCSYVSSQYFQADVNVVKGTTISIQVCTGLEGSRSLRLPDFMTKDTCKW